MANQWNDYAELYDEAQGETGDIAHQLLFDPAIEAALGDLHGKTILDAGCGNGYWVRRLAQKATNVVGIDESPALIGIAKAKENPSNALFKVGDLEKDMDFASGSFDVVLSSMVFHYLANIESQRSSSAVSSHPVEESCFASSTHFFSITFERRSLLANRRQYSKKPQGISTGSR